MMKIVSIKKIITKLVEIIARTNDVQAPIPTDGDSVYVKDIWVEHCDVTNWVDADGIGGDIIKIPFNNLHTAIRNISSDDPKKLRIHFNRTINLFQVGLGCAIHPGENFSNAKITVLGSGEVSRGVLDESLSNTKYTSRNYQFSPELCNAIDIDFHTSDPICISNITIQKVDFNVSRMQALNPSGTVVDIGATTKGNLKFGLEEIDPTAGAYQKYIDDYTTAKVTYFGMAEVGKLDSDANWQIYIIDETGNFPAIRYADGDNSMSKVWDDRTTYTY